ncbi:MAG: T9SS type A sorting domain-containing protein [Bacteroidales bacterium]|nr:T9SS type A sorting domain-containing protein [Bacteroidales bacterium]
MNNPSGITLQNNLTTSGTLTMTSGNINSGSYILELGTSTSVTGTLNWTSGNIIGSFKRWIAASTAAAVDLPVGTATSNHKARITFANNTGGSLTARFEPGDPGNNAGFPLTESGQTINASDQYTEGSWTLLPATLTSTSYALELTGTGFTSAGTPDAEVRIMKRPDGGGNWILNGTHVAGSAPVAKRSGLNGFSRFALGKPNMLKKISGTITYYNSSNTLLNTGVTVKLYQDGSQVGSDYNVTDGTYEFSGLTPGAYELRTFSSNSVEGSINTTDAAQVNYWWAIPYLIEKVRFYAGDVTGPTYYVNSSDALRIQNHFLNGTAFDKGTWTFWRAGETIGSNSNPSESYPQVSVNTSNITANLYGLCAGDFNRSFIPGTLKSTWSSPEIIHTGARLAGCNESVELPLRIGEPCKLGAISLILNLPGDLVEINDVIMNETGGVSDWSFIDSQLRISWFTANPVYFGAKDTLFILKLKTTAEFTSGNVIKINLADDPLNELADGSFDAIINPVLETDVIEAASAGTDDKANLQNLSFECRPNPFNNQTMFLYFIPYEGHVTIEIKSMMGNVVSLIADQLHSPGRYSINTSQIVIAPGIYFATLRLQSKNKTLMKNLKLVKE